MFNTFKGVLNNTKLSEENKGKLNSFIFKRWISGEINGLMYSSYINDYDISPEVLYEYYKCIFKDKKVKYIPWIKDISNSSEDLKVIQSYYKCSEEIAIQYSQVLPKKEIEKIRNKFGGKIK